MEMNRKISREDFMEFFRDTDKLNQLTVDDRIEIFQTILVGSDDITCELLNGILRDYCVDNFEVVEITNDKK